MTHWAPRTRTQCRLGCQQTAGLHAWPMCCPWAPSHACKGPLPAEDDGGQPEVTERQLAFCVQAQVASAVSPQSFHSPCLKHQALPGATSLAARPWGRIQGLETATCMASDESLLHTTVLADRRLLVDFGAYQKVCAPLRTTVAGQVSSCS